MARGPEDGSTRIRDLPGPRRNPSLAGPLFRAVWAWPYRVVLAGLHRARFRPWHLTLLSLVASAVVGWLLVTGRHFLGGILLVPAGLFDVFDGGLARLRGEESRKGALIDSVNDRLSDVIVFGALLYSLSSQGRTTAAALTLSALVASLFVSHVRAEGEALGLDLSGGLFQRLERFLALMVGLMAPGALVPSLAALTALGAVTALQRTATAWRSLPSLQRSSR